MGQLIGTSNGGNYGENYFISKAIEYLDDNNIIYWNRQLYGREFDVCILIPDKGILVVELKGWREENILRIDNNDAVIINTDDGEVAASPQKQARGYRFSLDRYIRQSIDKHPLIFQMVCLPQVTHSFYLKHRLDVVMEERFTILKEDLANKAAFFKKLDQALREVSNWKRDAFDQRTMLEVRNLFETDISLSADCGTEKNVGDTYQYKAHDYSRFYFFSATDPMETDTVKDAVNQFFHGSKLFCVFSSKSQMENVLHQLDGELSAHGLVRDRENIKISFNNKGLKHLPELRPEANSIMGFNFSFSVVEKSGLDIPSFCVKNGKTTAEQDEWLARVADSSQFNREQYIIEHADPQKNIVIRAGAGTGKSHTMISRIGYILYSQNTPIQKMAERIVMITFTNEAADQMEAKLKIYFQNYYLVTSDADYLGIISRIDHMQISTIHAFAKQLIAQLGTSFGYGVDLGITSSEFYRRKKVSDLLDAYIQRKEIEEGRSYTDKLGMPVYAIRDSIMDFIGKLHNKSVDICSITAQDFGDLLPDDTHRELHELLATVIPEVEREYFSELRDNNKIHLSSMMSVLNRFINDPDSEKRIKELKPDATQPQFMFVDEFQDTDNSQIESLLKLAELLNYRLFVVGDIKQCIYRFRGAKEKAFDQLKIKENREQWLEFSLQRNYRTDVHLLNLFDASFRVWGARDDEILSYVPSKDRLIGTRDYNSYLSEDIRRFYRKITIASEDLRIPALAEEIKRLQSRVKYEEEHGIKLSAKEKSIAILVRENWQADMVRNECGHLGISVHTNTGGDLYMSQPALDMLTLINALLHFDEADYLYNLVASNFFALDIPKSNLYKIRENIRSGGWRARVDDKEQVNYLINFMNLMLANMVGQEKTWWHIVASLRTKPVLQVLRQIYSTLEPWNHFSDDPWKQHYYQMNVDLLFEEIINACNVDRLTINTLQGFLYNCVVSHVSVDSRTPPTNGDEVSIQCITVHKSKGLEYGHVILPFCSTAIDYIKKSQLHISASKCGDKYQIGYCLHVGDSNQTVQNDYYDETVEKAEKSREETRILYVAMTRAIRSFSWIELEGKQNMSWQNLIETGD